MRLKWKRKCILWLWLAVEPVVMDVLIVTKLPETDMPCPFMKRPSMLLVTLSIVQYVAVFAPQEKR